ncbi:MAG: EAL domain-containing protein [Firmicutes bacterium]|nr:EAL domain-containing protein [Bacillota bacterium]
MAVFAMLGLGMLSLLLTFGKGAVHAAERRQVKVAFFPMDGYHITNQDGSLDGMDVSYLKALRDYTDWEIEYVECASWEQALQMLADKEVDLVGSAQYSAERAEIYQYADLASGYTFGVIATNADAGIAYEDFMAMRRVTFGMVENYVRKTEFLQYLSDHDIDFPVIREYESTEKLQQALSAGEVDALVHTFTEIREGQRLIGRFAPRPFYYISYQGNDDLMRELNQAIADLKINQPELETELMNTFYYSRFDKAALLTTEEKKYLADTELLTVGYLDGHYPFSYEEDGEFKGLSREMLEGSIALTGQRLEYVLLEDEGSARKALLDGDIDILVYSADKKEVLDNHYLTAAREYAEIPLVLVMDRNSNIGDIRTLGTVSYLKEEAESSVLLQNAEIKVYGSQQEGMTAVKDGEVDAVLCDGYMAEHLFRTDFQYENLQIKNVFKSEYPISVVVLEENRLLSGILAKTITPIDYRAVSEYMLKENTYPLANLRTFIRNHSSVIILFLMGVLLLVILVAAHIVHDEKRIRKLMYKDTFMDIWNLNYLIYWGERKLLPEHKGSYAVVYLNVSQFRHYNIIYGWDAGEKLLEGIADLLTNSVDRKQEICARNQGDRFALLLTCGQREALLERLNALRNTVEEYIFANTENHMPVQMGLYFLGQQTKELQVALNYASQALDFTGDREENAIKVYDDKLEQMIKERHEREKLLQSVDVWKDFAVYYQPKVDIRNGEIVGAEALVRFLNPAEGGAVKAPGFFVPYYEQTGKITEIDFFVYESVCRLLRQRLDAGEKVVTISCNFSRMHFIKPGFAEKFEGILNKYRIDRNLIEVEITETLVIEKLQQNTVKETLDSLHQKGIHLSIDDFGAGHSSLGIFEQIPAAVIKLDRSFLLNQQDHNRQVAIMRGIVNMAQNLEAQIVCEGVETEADIRLMQEIGANVAQGYYYSKPIPEAEFAERLSGGGFGVKA